MKSARGGLMLNALLLSLIVAISILFTSPNLFSQTRQPESEILRILRAIETNRLDVASVEIRSRIPALMADLKMGVNDQNLQQWILINHAITVNAELVAQLSDLILRSEISPLVRDLVFRRLSETTESLGRFSQLIFDFKRATRFLGLENKVDLSSIANTALEIEFLILKSNHYRLSRESQTGIVADTVKNTSEKIEKLTLQLTTLKSCLNLF